MAELAHDVLEGIVASYIMNQGLLEPDNRPPSVLQSFEYDASGHTDGSGELERQFRVKPQPNDRGSMKGKNNCHRH